MTASIDASIYVRTPLPDAADEYPVTQGLSPVATNLCDIAQAPVQLPGRTAIDIPGEQMLRHELEKYFAPLRSKENTPEIDGLIHDRVKRLVAAGIDYKMLGQRIKSVEQRDWSMGLLQGAVQNGGPFACAGVIFDLFVAKPLLKQVGGNLATLGMVAGVFQVTADVVFGRALQDAFKDAYYTKGASPQARADDLPGIWARSRQLALSLVIPYTSRNLVRAVADVTLAATAGPAAVVTANLFIDSIGGLAAGAWSRYMMGGLEPQAEGLALFLASDDWTKILAAPEEHVSLNSLWRTGSAVTAAAGSAICAIPRGIAALSKASGLVGMGILGGGLAGLVPAQAAVGEAMGKYGPAAAEAVVRAVNVVGSTFLYAGLGGALVLAEEADSRTPNEVCTMAKRY